MLKVIHNPLTKNYKELKKLILGHDFPWYWNNMTSMKIGEGYKNNGYYHHCFLKRPDEDMLFSSPQSPYINQVYTVVQEILKFNNISCNVLYRMGANCDHATESGDPDQPHYDHEFPHKNLLIYFSDTNGGYTMVDDERYDGEENDIIIFDGLHYNKPPSKGRRIVLITTFI